LAERRRESAAPPAPGRARPLTSEADLRRGAEASELITQLRLDFEARDRLYERTDDVLWSRYPLNVPDNYRTTSTEVRSPLAHNIVSTISAALSVNPPQVNFEPLGSSQQAQANAELREHALEATWARQEQESKRQLLRLFIYSLISKGEGVLKTTERTSRWRGYTQMSNRLREDLAGDADLTEEERRQRHDQGTERYKQGEPYPITTTDVPPECFYYWRTLDGDRYIAEVADVPYLEVLDRFRAGLSPGGDVVPEEGMGLPRSEWARVMAGTSTITVAELWDYRACRTLLLGPGQGSARSSAGSGGFGRGTLVKHYRHRYGDPYLKTLRGPYFHALGITTASRLPERAGLSVLYPFLSLFPALDSYLTIQSNAAYLTGFPAFKRNQPPGATLAATLGGLSPQTSPFGRDGSEADALAAVSRIEPGAIYPWDISAVEMPRAGVDIDKIIDAIRGFLELALPSTVQGIVGGDTSGYALNQAAHLARLAWDPIVANAEVALSERTGFESWLIEHCIGETVYAWGQKPTGRGPSRGAGAASGPSGWVGLGPAELKGSHRYTVKLDPETPSNKALEIRSHVEMMQAGLETTAMAIEALGGDPGEVERGLIVENAKRSDFIQKMLMQRIQQRLGMGEAQALQSIGAGPDGMPAGIPGLAPPAGPGMPPGMAPGMAPPGLPGVGGEAGLGPGVLGPSGPGGGLPGMVQAPGQGMPLMQPGQGQAVPGGLPAHPPGSPVIPAPPNGRPPLPGRPG
jgi:hypothetical protein